MEVHWELRLCEGLGPWKLGAQLTSVLGCLRTGIYVAHVFATDDPLALIEVCLVRQGIKLWFEPKFQTLTSIELCDFFVGTNLSLKDQFFVKGSVPNLALISQVFGVSKSIDFIEDLNLFTLKYPGCLFVFPLPLGFKAKEEDLIRVVFAERLHLTCSKAIFFSGKEPLSNSIKGDKSESSIKESLIKIFPGRGIYLPNKNIIIDNTTSSQDLYFP